MPSPPKLFIFETRSSNKNFCSVTGYKKSRIGKCIDTDECESKTEFTEFTKLFGKCENTIGGYFLTCERGFHVNNGQCVDENECLKFDGRSGVCHNFPGTFEIVCENGFNLQGFKCLEIDCGVGYLAFSEGLFTFLNSTLFCFYFFIFPKT